MHRTMIEPLLIAASSYLPHLDKTRLVQAFEFAKNAHEGQTRKDGAPYITHPLSAALILTELRVDEDTLIACLLHDVPEDTSITLEDIEAKFGKNVAFLVAGITKLSKVHYRNDMQNRQIESLKKLFIHTAQDLRIILIKLADRLHNMQTLSSIPKPEKRERIAKETLEIFVPIANLLGIWELKSQLEDRCFEVLHPKEYQQIDEWAQQSQLRKASLLDRSIAALETLLKEKKMPYEFIEGRQKSYYSIFKKMQEQQKSFHEVYDLIGIRVIVQDIGQCYQVLGAIHQNFTPKFGRLKDYIALPKSNGYQSIHTTVFGLEGAMTEFQIRTKEMHLESEYGITAHYFYGEDKGNEKHQKGKRHKYQWVKDLLSLQKNHPDHHHFLETLKLDVFQDRIFVFTPKGDVIDLPQGATVLDFAYHVHTDIGNEAQRAFVNGQETPLWKPLANGDTVYVHCSAQGEGPHVEWFDWVQTNAAHTRIKEFLKQSDPAVLSEESTRLLRERLGLFGMEARISKEQESFLLEQFNFPSWEDLIANVSDGSLSLTELVSVLYSRQQMLHKMGQSTQDSDDRSELVHLLLCVHNKTGVMAEVTAIMSSKEFNIEEIHSYEHENREFAYLQFSGRFLHPEHLESLLQTLNRTANIESVCRIRTPQRFDSGSFGSPSEPSQ